MTESRSVVAWGMEWVGGRRMDEQGAMRTFGRVDGYVHGFHALIRIHQTLSLNHALGLHQLYLNKAFNIFKETDAQGPSLIKWEFQ